MYDVILQPTPSIPLAVLAAGFGGFAGALLSYIFNRIRDRQNERQRRAELRESLLSELMMEKDWFSGRGDSTPVIPHINQEVFGSRAHELGLLSREEREAVVEFYSFAGYYSTTTKLYLENLKRSTIPSEPNKSPVDPPIDSEYAYLREKWLESCKRLAQKLEYNETVEEIEEIEAEE